MNFFFCFAQLWTSGFLVYLSSFVYSPAAQWFTIVHSIYSNSTARLSASISVHTFNNMRPQQEAGGLFASVVYVPSFPRLSLQTHTHTCTRIYTHTQSRTRPFWLRRTKRGHEGDEGVRGEWRKAGRQMKVDKEVKRWRGFVESYNTETPVFTTKGNINERHHWYFWKPDKYSHCPHKNLCHRSYDPLAAFIFVHHLLKTIH